MAEWRELKDTHPDGGKGLAWLEGEERLLVIEVALLTEFGLTLPPETEPLRGFGRAGQINWRRTALVRHPAGRWRGADCCGTFLTLWTAAVVAPRR